MTGSSVQSPMIHEMRYGFVNINGETAARTLTARARIGRAPLSMNRFMPRLPPRSNPCGIHEGYFSESIVGDSA